MKFLAESSNKKNEPAGNKLGIYIHVPFCLKKCGYCDFYSFRPGSGDIDGYTAKIISELNRWGEKLCRPADSLYLGGGTPSLLGTENINKIIEAAKLMFGLDNSAEITVEMNPKDQLDFRMLKANRLSMGLQSSNEAELSALGRRHTTEDVVNTVTKAMEHIKNISLDVMLGIPYQTTKSLKSTLDTCLSLDVPHISCYMLKIEENTPFYGSSLPFPDDDQTAALYLYCCDYLKKHGYKRYEISNFARPGFESRHNMKYWLGCDYLGLGPAAHSRIDGRRFYYDRDFKAYMENPAEVSEGPAGDLEEDLMLRLRTDRGFDISGFQSAKKTALRLAESGLVVLNGGNVSLTDEGALLENRIIYELIKSINSDI